MKISSHGSMGCISILESKRHDNVVKIAHTSPERSIFNIKVVHFDLIIANETI